MRRSSRLPLALCAALLGLAVVSVPAPAIDESKPTAPCGNQFPGKAGNVDFPNLDLTGGFLKHEPAKGADATTVNLIVDNLDKAIPEGSTFVSWNLYWTGDDDVERFVRALTDFSGVVSYEHGQVEDLSAVTMSRPLGLTAGAFFEGKDGVVQLVVPPDIGGAAGTTLTGPYLVTYMGAPGVAAAPTPTRGPLTEVDRATGKPWKVATCTPASTPAPAPAPGAGSPPASPPPSGATPADHALPVRVLTRRARARGRSLAVKLRSSEPITRLSAQLVRGKRSVVGRGSLSKLNGRGTLKLKFRRKLRRGSYRLDLAGSDSAGRRRFASTKLTVR